MSFCTARARAETGYEAWLRYAPITDARARDQYAALPAVVVALDNSPIEKAAQEELVRGVRGMLGRTLRVAAVVPEISRAEKAERKP